MSARSKYLLGFLTFSLVLGLVAWSVYRNDGGRAADTRAAATTPAVSEEPYTGPVKYNPASCGRDAEEMVYFALGRLVFRLPYTTTMEFRALPREERAKLPKRPDPSEPEGCPDNPIAALSVKFAYRHSAREAGGADSEPPMLAWVGLVVARPGYSGTVGSTRDSFYHTQMTYSVCEEAATGIIACSWPNDRPRWQWGTFYKIKSTYYPTPLGHPIFVECYPTNRKGWQSCGLEYRAYEKKLSVYYNFNRKSLPIDRLVEYDRGLRAQIEKMRVPEYPWPE